ncbi:MAG TPA: MASE3 domain-containing protein [Spongiibacteraceae bacterium]|nr:MASE3 domain-containing protein [Spongiibacteraceae bacterium]
MRRNVRWLSRKNNTLAQRRGLLQIVRKYARVPPIAWMAGLTLLLAPWYWLPPVTFFVEPADYAPLHTLLELLATAVALMVITLAWNLRTEQNNRRLALLGAGFLAVALTDIGHTMSYVSMPDFITPNSTNKVIFFVMRSRSLITRRPLRVSRILE